MRLSTAELMEILDGCEGVTLGPWEMQEIYTEGDEAGEAFIVGARQQGLIGAALPLPTELDDCDFSRVSANGEHIARLSPERVSSLVTELLELREALRPFAALGRMWAASNLDEKAREEIRKLTFPADWTAANRALKGMNE